MQSYQKLKQLCKNLSSLSNAQQVLMWDEAVMMPEGAGAERAEIMSMISLLLHKLLTTASNSKLITAAKQESGLSSFDQANLKLIEEKYVLAKCIPPKLVKKIRNVSMLSEQAWRKMRAANNWRGFMPHLKEVFRLTLEVAKRRGEVLNLSPYDAMLYQYAPGFNQQSIDSIFSGLTQALPPLIKEIIQKQNNAAPLKMPQPPFAVEQQKQIGLEAMKILNFDFQHGRLDVSHHPFCGGTPEDVRITTRYNEKEFISAIMAVCHETGHALYEQGLPREWVDQTVGHVTSMAMHESQSLMLEMQVCSSKAFFQQLIPKLQQCFGNQEAFTAENLFHLATRVEPQLIRVSSDEVTYQSHILIRYEIEKKLFAGELKIQDLPAYWHEAMIKYLGLGTKGNDKDGVMQDMHWSGGSFGYFPAYTLGRLIGAQLFAAFLMTHPDFFEKFAAGDFHILKNWLHENVYAYASSIPTHDLLVKVTGSGLDAGYFLKHIRKQYLI